MKTLVVIFVLAAVLAIVHSSPVPEDDLVEMSDSDSFVRPAGFDVSRVKRQFGHHHHGGYGGYGGGYGGGFGGFGGGYGGYGGYGYGR